MKLVSVSVFSGLVCLLLAGCVQTDWQFSIEPLAPGSQGAQAGMQCFVESFRQPEGQMTHSLDILFVADTSGSMADNRVAVADGLHALVGQLPSNVDYRIAMLLAHSSASTFSGKLWSPVGFDPNPVTGFPVVLDSSQMDQATLQSRLRTMMQLAPESGGQGEMGMYSLLRLLSAEGITEARSHGFFRNGAALAVVFISDENDICAAFPMQPPAATGLTALEEQIRAVDCTDGISAQSVIEAVRSVQSGSPFLFGAIVNDDINFDFGGANDGYGWGYMDIIQQGQGVAINIGASDYAPGLAHFGSLAGKSLELKLSLELQRSPVVASSIAVVVDGLPKGHVFAPEINTVHFDDAGGARSWVEVNYCIDPEGGIVGGSVGI